MRMKTLINDRAIRNETVFFVIVTLTCLALYGVRGKENVIVTYGSVVVVGGE